MILGESKVKNWLKVFFFFFILGLSVYFNSLNNKFLMDDYVILENPIESQIKYVLSQWDPYREQALGVMDSNAYRTYYRPMAHMALNFCYASFKNIFWKYHLLNLFLFVFASSLIYLLIVKITGNNILALLAGLFYLIHPINGIVVNYISASVFAFQMVFMLGSILLLLESLEKNNRVLYFLSLLFSFFSLFWHESGMMTPLYISAVILLFRKDTLKKKTLYLTPYFLIVISYFVFWSYFFGGDKHILGKGMNVWENLAGLFQVFAWYLTKLFYSQGIVMQWAIPVLNDRIILKVTSDCLLFIVFLFIFIKFFKEKICQLAIAWFLIGFAPLCISAFKNLNGFSIEPHWFVFSSIGFFILAAYFCSILLIRFQKSGLVLLFIILFVLGSVSHAYNQIWVDQKTYASFWIRHAPYVKLAYFYLADAYQREGNFKVSKGYYSKALSGDLLLDVPIYENLGYCDAMEGHFKDALLDYKMALKINPNSAIVYANLAALYYSEGRFDRAKENLERSLMLNPLQIHPRIGLAYIFLKNAEYQEAINQCLINLKIKHDDTETLFLLIDIYGYKADMVNIRKYASYLMDDENDPEVLMKLGAKMSRLNMNDVAMGCYKKILRVAPDYKDAYYEAGELFEISGKYDEAIHIWNIGSSIGPSDQRFKDSIAKANQFNVKR